MSLFREKLLPLYVTASGDEATDVAKSMAAMVFSASRIRTWIACNRKAGWEYFAGYQSPPIKATDRGKAVHTILEKAVPPLVLGAACEIDRTTEEGAIAAEVVPYIPSEVLGFNTTFEQRFEIQGRHTWQGYIDLRAPGIVVDYKTTSDFKYMKTEADLMTDPQAVLYAEHGFIADAIRPKMWLRWIYTRTRGAKQARAVDLYMDRPHSAAMFGVLESFADEMQAAADAAPPKSDPIALHKYVLTLPGNEDRCNDYGGCPHRSRCGIFFQDPNRPKDTHHMTPLERLQAMTALNGGAANEASVQNVGASTKTADVLSPLSALLPTPPPVPPSALFARLAAENGLAVASPVASVSPVPQATIDATVKAAEGINPPKRTRGRPKHDTVPAPAMEGSATKELITIAQEKGALPVPDRLAALPPHLAAMVTAVEATPVAPLEGVPVPSDKPIETLCVGCIPFGHAFETLDNILAQVRDMITPTVYFGGYGYKTNGMVIEGVTKLLAGRTIEVLVVADPRLPEAALVLSHLRAMSSVVIEAIR